MNTKLDDGVCPGILWLVNKDKLVVAGFTPGSQAKQAGVTCGDILRKVDGKDVLSIKAEARHYNICMYMKPYLHIGSVLVRVYMCRI